ncbi:toxin YdaT family protein [Bordetella petrii]|uniref:Uncharacterized protein n=1 Tax=Bordetella petrii (strain ATCC BAA-461 / DSM 12804 / CCUG 43448 / CIP 107267 / Se-1111R) TaxID=340100 RepID=A9I8W7_BORPD|nr:toxin YdaT family protein [Bordetella petrii]CAP41298.1 hypothetical protein predicted by Glimmer/Critica [Bordetella petrii]
MSSTVPIQAAQGMRNESHKSLIAVVREHVSAWRKAEGWSRETVVDEIVRAHADIGGPVSSGILFDPATRDTFERMKVNADRVFRWLDDDSKDTNLLPANFLPSILAAMPVDRRRHCLDDILRPMSMAVRLMALTAGDGVDITQVAAMIREGAEAHAAAAALLGGQATPATMAAAHREISEAITALRNVRASLENQMGMAGMDMPVAVEGGRV